MFWGRIFIACLIGISIGGEARSDPITFIGQGPGSRWSVDGKLLNGSISAEFVADTLIIERDDGGRCEIEEDGFSYFPVILTYRISRNFVASNRSIVDQKISLRMVFSRRIDTEIYFNLPKDTTDNFSIRRRQSDALDRLSLNRGGTPAAYVVGFIKAMFSTKYYDQLLKSAPDSERRLIERRRLYFAKIAANFLYQQHVQDTQTNLFSNDPIILPDGDAYDLLLKVLSTKGDTARNTVLGTRYRSFWFIRDRIEKAVESDSRLSGSLLVSAKSISECLLSDDGLRRIDPILLAYLKSNRFHIPSSRDRLLEPGEKESFNMWRVIYLNLIGEVPSQYDYDTVLSQLFNE